MPSFVNSVRYRNGAIFGRLSSLQKLYASRGNYSAIRSLLKIRSKGSCELWKLLDVHVGSNTDGDTAFGPHWQHIRAPYLIPSAANQHFSVFLYTRYCYRDGERLDRFQVELLPLLTNHRHRTTLHKLMNVNMSSAIQDDGSYDTQASHEGSFSNEESIYHAISQYPFDTDSEYLNGLSTIFGHPSTPPSPLEISENADLVLQAKCFYYTRKHGLPSIDPAAYHRWLQSRASDAAIDLDDAGQPVDLPAAASQTQSSTTGDVATSADAAVDQAQAPPYPDSFAAIVDLITRNVPVPGIEEIPDTVLERGASKVDFTARRRKPWERIAEQREEGPMVAGASLVGSRTSDLQARSVPGINRPVATGEGVVKILQPNSIPDSGLLSKD